METFICTFDLLEENISDYIWVFFFRLLDIQSSKSEKYHSIYILQNTT